MTAHPNPLVHQLSETKWNLYLSIAMDTVVGISVILYVAFAMEYESATDLVMWFVIGWFAFTLLEWFTHDVLFHKGSNLIVKGHGKHHQDPTAPINLPFFTAIIVGIPLAYGMAQLIGLPNALVFTAAMMLAYMTFSLFHMLLHRINYVFPYFRYMQKFHDVHHVKPWMNQGVTNPIWDFVFRTYEPLDKYEEKDLEYYHKRAKP